MSAPALARDSIRPALRGDPEDIAIWALDELTGYLGLSNPEVAIVLASIVKTAPDLMPVLLPCPCERHCVGCGCCDHRACPDGCVWATPTLCSRCV